VKNELKFEEALKRLEEIVEKLEGGELGLEEALKIFEEGIKLIRFCEKKLEEVEKRIDILVKEGEEIKLKPWTPEEESLFGESDE